MTAEIVFLSFLRMEVVACCILDADLHASYAKLVCHSHVASSNRKSSRINNRRISFVL